MYPLVMVAGSTESQPFHDRYPCYIEISPLICSVNQWTGFYMIETSVMTELKLPFGD